MTDIYEDIRIVVQRHREQAAAEERAKIVAWLYEAGYRQIAAAIEAKEHLK
jgi:hypothetical protein